eukprot:9373827-Lingulodinium_polyedra.AAC.1
MSLGTEQGSLPGQAPDGRGRFQAACEPLQPSICPEVVELLRRHGLDLSVEGLTKLLELVRSSGA